MQNNHSSYSTSAPVEIEALPYQHFSLIKDLPAPVVSNTVQLDPVSSKEDVPPSDYLIGSSYDIILLIDVRETFGYVLLYKFCSIDTQNCQIFNYRMSKVKEIMRTQSVKWEVRSLPVGDFVWIARNIRG